MRLIKLEYFATGDSFTGSHFKEDTNIGYINLKYILSISTLITFNLPLSGKKLGKFSIVKMINNDRYYIHKSEYVKLGKYYNNKEDN